MASTTFTNNVTLTDADWFNDLNRLHYAILGDPADAAAVKTALGIDLVALTNPIKIPCRVATTAAINLAAPGAAIDAATMAAGDRFLDKDNATAASRGVYIWNGAAVPATRAPDADSAGELLSGMLVTVSEGTVNAGSIWMLTTPNPITIGTTALTFERKDAGAVVAPDLLNQNNTWNKAQSGLVTSLALAASYSIDLNQSNNFLISGQNQNFTMGNPINLVAGQSGIIMITQDATGGRTITSWGSYWRSAGGVKPVLSTPASSYDLLSYYVINSSLIFVSIAKGLG